MFRPYLIMIYAYIFISSYKFDKFVGLVEFSYIIEGVSWFRQTSAFCSVSAPYSVCIYFRQYLFLYLFLGFLFLFLLPQKNIKTNVAPPSPVRPA